jgi:type II secretory pathway predicted ATPase ExeA
VNVFLGALSIDPERPKATMYETFFGLAHPPFELAPNPRFLIFTPSHLEALSNLEYGIFERKGITLLVAEAGTGKTTLLRRALSQAQQQRQSPALVVYVNNPTLTRPEFLRVLAQGFKLSDEAARSKPDFLAEFDELLRNRSAQALPTVLVIDEAQSLSYELLEEVRLLANMDSDTEKLLSVILAGQPELADRLNEPALRQLKQRIVLRCTLAPLKVRETAAYIAGRVRLAGGEASQLFTREAVIAMHEASGGIPRTLSVICDNALLTAFANEVRPVTAKIVAEVCRDFDLLRGHAASHLWNVTQEHTAERQHDAAWQRGGQHDAAWHPVLEWAWRRLQPAAKSVVG